MDKEHIKKELKKLFKSMDFISKRFLAKEQAETKEFQTYFNIYQQLGLAWEFLGLQCEHWDGYRKTRDKKEVCKICGKVKGVDDGYLLLKTNQKVIGNKLMPNSKKTFENKKNATVLNDTIKFHGAALSVDVHNSYKSSLFGDKHKINIADERIVELKESGVVCSVDQHLINVRFDKNKGKKKYGGFLWELKKEQLKHFPVIFEFDDDYNFLGLRILR